MFHRKTPFLELIQETIIETPTVSKEAKEHILSIFKLAMEKRFLEHIHQKDYESALKYINKVLKIYPTNVVCWNLKAFCLIHLEKTREAIEFIDKGLKIFNDKHLLIFQGDCYQILQEYERAEQYYSRALEIDPFYEPALKKKALCLLKLGYFTVSFQLLNGELYMIEKPASYTQNEELTAKYYRSKGSFLLKNGEFDEAIKEFDNSLLNKPDSELVFREKANCYIGLGDYENAASSFDSAIVLNPNNALNWIKRAHLLIDMESYEDALKVLDIASGIHPFPKLYVEKGVAHALLGNFHEALKYFNQEKNLYSYYPDFYETWFIFFLKGKCHFILRQFEEAKTHLSESMKLNNDSNYKDYWDECFNYIKVIEEVDELFK